MADLILAISAPKGHPAHKPMAKALVDCGLGKTTPLAAMYQVAAALTGGSQRGQNKRSGFLQTLLYGIEAQRIAEETEANAKAAAAARGKRPRKSPEQRARENAIKYLTVRYREEMGLKERGQIPEELRGDHAQFVESKLPKQIERILKKS